MKKILIADDAEINRDILKSIFEEQFEIIEVANGQEAIEMVSKYDAELSLIFLDLMMPVKDGIEVLRYMNCTGVIKTIPVILITGEATVESDMRAYELGAADIIYKPFSKRLVTRRALNIIELYENRNEMEKQLSIRTSELRKYQEQVSKNNEFLINALSSVVEFRSLESGEHITRVKSFSRIVLNEWRKLHPEWNFSDIDIDQMVNASALHDIGKIGIPDEILLKPGKLTAEEFEIMKTHTTLGCEILEKFRQEDSDFYRYCYDICRYHHEKYDGRGYPDGLKGDDIPIWAQVVSVVDVYDALISPRVYKAAFEVDVAIEMIKNGECGQFNPEVINCMLASESEIRRLTSELADSIEIAQ